MVSVLLDENENCEIGDQKVFEQVILKEPNFKKLDKFESWKQIREITNEAQFLTDFVIPSTELTLSIQKKRNAFSIMIQKPESGEVQGINDESGCLEFRVNPHGGDRQISKIVKETGLSYLLVNVKI